MSKIDIRPLTPDLWPSFEAVMGPNGACAGCWCMFWRVPRSLFTSGSGPGNRASYKKIVKKGPPPGLIAFVDGKPAGWVQVGPRADLPTLDRSRLLKRVDDEPVWSISCFFVRSGFRGKGLSAALVKAASDFAKKNGAKLVEAYPWSTTEKKSTVTIYTGVATTFERAGFKTVAARVPHRPIMRLALKGTGRAKTKASAA
jgi:GNAT superfamily N-acetyltransferase